MRKIGRLLVLAIPLIVVGGVLAYNEREIGQTGETMAFPPGSWTFSAHPYMGDGFNTRPVVVTSVASNAKTLGVTSVRINNISSKPVRAVKLGWSLREETNKSKILQQGETSLVAMDPDLAAGGDQILKLQVVSFLEINKPLIKKGRLEGSYRLDLGVTQVLFDDQSGWRVGERVAVRLSNSGPMVNVVYSKDANSFTVTPLEVPLACSHQKCQFDGVPPPSYTCTGSEDEEFCTNCGQSCCNTICGSQPSCDCT